MDIEAKQMDIEATRRELAEAGVRLDDAYDTEDVLAMICLAVAVDPVYLDSKKPE